MTRRPLAACIATVLLAGASGAPLEAQLPSHLRDYPLARLKTSGDLVAPFFDGWYDNGDGTVTYVFGFMNRNVEEVVDIPLGPNNYLEPARYDGVQPTHFPVYDPVVSRERRTATRSATIATDIPRGLLRERGAFAVTVPNDGTEVVWTLSHAGHTYSVPGHAVSPAYELSRGPAAAGSLAPAIRFSAAGPESVRREGIVAERMTTSVGAPLRLSARVQDRGEREKYDLERTVYPVDSFSTRDTRFGKQCCWSNAFVPVTVTP